MKRSAVIVVAAIALLVCGSAFAQGQGQGQDGVWRVMGDNGETVRVLPTPAAAKAFEVHGDGPQTALRAEGPGNQFYSVYNASYGSVPGSLQNHGGYVITNASYFAIYYNSQPASTLQSGISSFVNYFPAAANSADPAMRVLGQYGAGTSIANAGSFVDTNATPSKISDTQIQSYLAGLFNSGKVAFVANTRIYGVYLPSGTVSTQGRYRSCVNYCGYHNSFTYNGQNAIYAVYPYNSCSGCSLSGKTVLDMETIVTSHEIREAMTDPVNAWWEDSSGYEADDKCAWHNLYQQSGSGAWIQPEYSNALAGWPRGCVTP